MEKAVMINIENLDTLFCNSSKIISATYPSLSIQISFSGAYAMSWSEKWRALTDVN